MEKEKISVIVPIYNTERYLKQCIDSIINQTYKNLEIILIDDGSTDYSGDICDEYAQKDNRIIVIHNENQGQAAAKNFGLELATGEYIGFVDSDDFIDIDMYEKLIGACIRNNTKISMCGRHNVTDEGEFINDYFSMPEEKVISAKETIKGLLTWEFCDSASWDKVYHSSVIGGIRYQKDALFDDINVIARIISRCDRITHIGQAKYNYRSRKTSISRNQEFTPRTMDMICQAELLYEFVENKYPELKNERDYFLFVHINGLMARASKTDNVNYREYLKIVVRKGIQYLYTLHCGKVTIKTKIMYILKIAYIKLKIIIMK